METEKEVHPSHREVRKVWDLLRPCFGGREGGTLHCFHCAAIRECLNSYFERLVKERKELLKRVEEKRRESVAGVG